jgi:hypothetical protein
MKIIYVLLLAAGPLFAIAPMPSDYFNKQEINGCEEFVQHLFSQKQVSKKLQRACLNPLKTKSNQEVYLMANIQARLFLINQLNFSLNAFEDAVLALRTPEKKSEIISKELHGVFDNFLSHFLTEMRFNFLTKEKYSHIPYDFKLKPFTSLQQLLDNLSIPSPAIEMVPSLNLFCLLPAQRAQEFLTQAQQVFRPGNNVSADIRKIKFSQRNLNFSLPVWRVLHGAGFFKNEEQESIYPEGKSELEEIISFATSSEENLREYLFFAHFQSISTAEPGHYNRYNQTVRKLRKAIFTYWLSDEVRAQKFMPIHKKSSGPFYAKLDAWFFGLIKLQKLLLENCPGTKKTYLAYVNFLIKKQAPLWEGSSEEFLVSPSYELAAKNQNPGFYTKIKKNLMEKAGIADVQPSHPRYLFSSYADQLSYMEKNFPRIENLLSELLDPFEPEEWALFINGKARKLLPIWTLVDQKLRDTFPKDVALQYLKKGYLHYKKLPWAAWCFLHGFPFEFDSIRWQEMAQVVFEHYSKAGRLVDFLRYFKAEVEPNLRANIFAFRTRSTREQIIQFHWQNRHEEFQQAKKEQLIEPELLQKIESELRDEQVENSQALAMSVENEQSLEVDEILAPEPMVEKLGEPTEVEEIYVAEVALVAEPVVAEVGEPVTEPANVEVLPVAEEIPTKTIAEEQPDLASETPAVDVKPTRNKRRKRLQRSQRKVVVNLPPKAENNLLKIPNKDIKVIIPSEDIEECLTEDRLEHGANGTEPGLTSKATLLDIKPGDSDLLCYAYKALKCTALNDSDWDTYFQALFGYFVEDEQVQMFLAEHVKCKALNEQYLPLHSQCQVYLHDALGLLRELRTIWPEGYRNEVLHLQAIWQTLAQYDSAPNPNFLDNFCLRLCQEQALIMRKIEDNVPLSAGHYERFKENKILIQEHFAYLKTWVIGQKCNLLKNADYCHEVLPTLKRHYETLLSQVKYCQQIRSANAAKGKTSH